MLANPRSDGRGVFAKGEGDIRLEAEFAQLPGVFGGREEASGWFADVKSGARRIVITRESGGEGGRVAGLGRRRGRQDTADDGAGRYEVFEGEPAGVGRAGADDGDAGKAPDGLRHGAGVGQRAGKYRAPAGELTEHARPVRGEEDAGASSDGGGARLHWRISVVEAFGPEAAYLAKEDRVFQRRRRPGKLDLVRDVELIEPVLEERRDRRGRAQGIDDDITVGVHRQGLTREHRDIDEERHRRKHAPPEGSDHLWCMLWGMDSRPVGMFDSGVGGLSVYQAFRALAPSEDVVYFADTAYFPYGPRPAAEVRKRAFAVTRRLLDADAKLIVVACNTASAAAIDDLRQAFPVPFVGIVPGLKPATQRSRSGHVAILATPGTLDGELFARVVAEFGRGTTVTTVPGVGLAELVEGGLTGTDEAATAVGAALSRAVGDGADTVVLGCTHYHFLAADILRVFPGLAIVDTTEPVARRCLQVLCEARLEAPAGRIGHLDLIVTGDRASFRGVMRTLGFAPATPESAGIPGR